MSWERHGEELRDDLVRKLGRVLECTRLLDLNRDDGDFRRPEPGPTPHAPPRSEGGKIYYVVDTNFYQAFIDPSNWRRCARLFHDPIWPRWSRLEDEARYKHLIDTVTAQATLLATEFIMSDELQRADGRIFMSKPHFAEAAIQIEYTSKALIRALNGERHHDDNSYFMEDPAAAGEDLPGSPLDPSDHPQDSPSQKENIRAAKASARAILDAADLRGYSDEAMKEEMLGDENFLLFDRRELEGLTKGRFQKVREGYIVSRICRILAQDRILEPISQIQRLAINGIGQRIEPIEWTFNATEPEDLAEIADLKKDWRGHLESEIKIRRTRGQRSRARRTEALDADAETLAHLIWATRRRKSDAERIVFVTGDSLLLDAYRRCYAKQDKDEPFIIRPLALYAPQFNLRDAKATTSPKVQVFDGTRQALESTALSYRLSLIEYYKEHPDRPTSSAIARDRFCVEAQDGAQNLDSLVEELVPLSNHLGTLRGRVSQLDQQAFDMRQLERVAVGALPHLVKSRVDVAVSWAQEFLGTAGQSEDEGWAAEWLQRRLDRAIEAGFQFSGPAVIEEILKLARKPVSSPSRAPLGLRIRFPFDGKNLSAIGLLECLTDPSVSSARLRPLIDLPALMFALASWLAFRHEAWEDAAHFADLASQIAEADGAAQTERAGVERAKADASAASNGEPGPTPPEDVHVESLYLRAAALRFSMASQEPDRNRHPNDIWRRKLVAAEDALAICIAHHRQHDHLLRENRALAERAAVRLTYCAWAAVGRLGDLGPYNRVEHQRGEGLNLVQIFRGAMDDLASVAEALPIVRARVESDASPGEGMSREALNWIERQAAINPECSRLVYEALRLREAQGERLLPPMKNFGAEGRSIVPESKKVGSISHSTMKGYLLSEKAREPGDNSEIRKKIAALSMDGVKVSLDQVMLLHIQKRWQPSNPRTSETHD